MGKKFLFKTLSRFVDIKPGEEILCFYLFFYFFFITWPNSIIQAVKNAKYLILAGSLSLPLAYLSTAALMGFVVTFHTKLQERVPRRTLVVSSLIFFIMTAPLFGMLFMGEKESPSWLPLTFWIWSNVFAIVLITQFWIVINDVFNPREAKRLIGFFGSGGILGGIIGGLFAGFFAQIIPDYLLYIATGILIVSCIFINFIFIRQKSNQIQEKSHKKQTTQKKIKEKVGFRSSLDAVRKHKYLMLLAAVVALTEIVSTLIDFQAKTFIESATAQKNLMSVFGYFEAALLVIPLLFQLFLTSKLIKRYGVRFALLLYPITILLCSLGLAGFAMTAGIVFAIIIKTSDKSLSFSINQSVRELLFIPVSPEFKNSVKIFIDMFINRVAKGAGALILLLIIGITPLFYPNTSDEGGIQFVARRVQIVSLFSILFIIVWIVLNIKVSKEYTNTIKNKLKLRWKRADSVVGEKLDVDFMKLILDTLEDKERSDVLYAMDLFDLTKKDKLTPEVRKFIGYTSDERKVSSMDVLFQTEGATLSPQMDDSLINERDEKEIKEIMQLDSYQEIMKGYMERVFESDVKDSETARMELAKGIGLMEAKSSLVEKLEDLIEDKSLDVSRYAMESAAKLKLREYLPQIIEKLENPQTKTDSSAALVKYGTKIIGTLSDYLSAEDETLDVKVSIIGILAQIGNQETADLLSLELKQKKNEIDSEIIDALDKIRSENSNIQFLEQTILPEISKRIKDQYSAFLECFDKDLSTNEEDKSGDKTKVHKIIHTDIFKLLGLLYPHEDIIKAYQNIEFGTKDSIGYAIELLDNILPAEIKIRLFPLVDNISLEARIHLCREVLPFLSSIKNQK
ncbi:MAG: MFS transporter [Candidatus Aminicenantes bacterium]|nr:MFS transporter [Candidatus Aminicenantes bacterium]